MALRDELHRLVDQLPEQQAFLAKRLLEVLLEEKGPADPFLRALAAAPVDDESETPEEKAAVEEALRDVAQGHTVSDNDLWKRLGHEPEKS